MLRPRLSVELLRFAPWIFGALILAAPVIADPELQEQPEPSESLYDSCRVSFGCGGIIDITARDLVHQDEDMAKLEAKLLVHPVAPEQAWQQLLLLQNEAANRRQHIAEFYRREHWQEPPPAASPSSSLDRLSWLDLWRRNNPNERAAWCQWSEEAEQQLGAMAAISEMESALAADANSAAHSCLLEALHKSGATARLRELIGTGEPEDPEQNRRLEFMPAELRSAYAFALNQYQLEAALEVLKQARRIDPENLELELETLRTESFVTSEEQVEREISARLLDIARGEYPLAMLGVICEELSYTDHHEAAADCEKRFAAKVVESDLLFGPSETPQQAQRLGDATWDHLIFQVRSQVIREAVKARDLDAVAPLLRDGSGYGYSELWSDAIGWAGPDGDEDDAEEKATFRQSLCDLLARSAQDGTFDRPIYDATHRCSDRANTLAEVLEECELEKLRSQFWSRISKRLSDLPASALATFDLPANERIEEIEKRIVASDQAALEVEILEYTLTDLLLETGDTSRLLEQGRRFLNAQMTFDGGLSDWLSRVRSLPEVELEILRELRIARPADNQLRLRLAIEALRVDPPETAAATELAEAVEKSPEASIRERAEASYLLGRAAILEGQLERATPLLADFFKTRLEHAACPPALAGCERDYALHLIAVGDWPRLEAHQKRRDEKMFEQRAELRARGVDPSGHSSTALERQSFHLIHQDALLDAIFFEPACGLPTALPHVEALALEHPGDSAIRERLTHERARTCIRDEGPFPFSAKAQPTAATLLDRENLLLLSHDYP